MSKSKDKAITIKDVARRAKVSISTVSRVLNNPEAVIGEKRDRVIEAIEKLKYVPNPVARALNARKVGMIGAVVPNIINNCISEMIKGALKELEKNGYDLLLFTSNEDINREKSYLKILQEKMVDGAIFIASCGGELDFTDLAQVMPIALIDRYEKVTVADKFGIDDTLGFQKIISYLKELKHTNIGFIAGDPRTLSSIKRTESFKKAMEIEGLQWKEKWIKATSWSIAGGYTGFQQLIEDSPEITAAVCISDMLAFGALTAAHQLGIKVPEDISITGCDNFPESNFLAPPLTTLNYPNYEMGRLAARSIINRIKDNSIEPQQNIIPVEELIIRQSCCENKLTKLSI